MPTPTIETVASSASPTSSSTNPHHPPTSYAWQAWVTSPTEASVRLAVPRTSSDAPLDVITVPVRATGRNWLGVGAALTDSSVELLTGRPALRALLYDPDRPDGAQLNMIRLPLSATDFSTTWWTWGWNAAVGAWRPPPQAIAAADTAAAIAALRSDLFVAAVPWSAPGSMKTSGSIAGGALTPGSETDFAKMLVDQVEWLRGKGLLLGALAIVNEPGYSDNYPTMTMTDQQLATVGTMVKNTIGGKPELWAVDHNWSDRPRVDNVLALAPGVFDRAAFHCYAGSPGEMSGLPVAAVMTECTGTSDTWTGTFRWDAANLIMGSIEAGSTGLMMWNLALDPAHGPKRPGGCDNCRGLLTV
ncbi:MAG TPA: hypothetical protein VH419_02615, partial [Nocardioidaceae bacterium]